MIGTSRSTRSGAFASAALVALLLGACGGSAATPTARTQNAAPAATSGAAAKASSAPTSAKAPTARPSTVVAATAAPAAAATTAATTAPAASTAAAPASSAPIAAPQASSAPVAASAAPAPAATPAPAAQVNGVTVAVTLIDVGIKLDRTSTSSGPVTFTIKNSGTVAHELAFLKTDVAQDQIPVDPNKPGMVSQPGYMTQTPTLAVGASTTLSLTLAPGKYVLLCNQPAHYLIGMHTAFTTN